MKFKDCIRWVKWKTVIWVLAWIVFFSLNWLHYRNINVAFQAIAPEEYILIFIFAVVSPLPPEVEGIRFSPDFKNWCWFFSVALLVTFGLNKILFQPTLQDDLSLVYALSCVESAVFSLLSIPLAKTAYR